MVATQTRKTPSGFQIPKRTARLVFTDSIYDGAEVVVRLDIPMQVFIEIHDSIDQGEQLKVFKIFGDYVLDDWNLQDDNGNSFEVSGTGMNRIDFNLANLIMTEWMGVAVSPSVPLEQS